MLANRLALGLLALCAVAAILGPLWESRRRGAELSVRAYLAAVAGDDLDAALATIALERRAGLRERVETQLGNAYRVEVIALGRPSLLARALGTPGTTATATILAEVSAISGERWKSTSVVELVRRDDRWYLLEPPFA